MIVREQQADDYEAIRHVYAEAFRRPGFRAPQNPGSVPPEVGLFEALWEASERYGYPAGFLARYFEKLRYRFGPRERAGLLTFLELARDVGELDEVPELRFVARAEAPV